MSKYEIAFEQYDAYCDAARRKGKNHQPMDGVEGSACDEPDLL